MVAFHFPPLAGSSGIQRTLRFVQQLPEFGWEPVVLTASTRAYERTSDDLMTEVSDGVAVTRAFALDAARHLSVHGRYPGFLALPDRWMTWQYGAIPAGMRLIRQHRPRAIWSTFPIATAHIIGSELSRRSQLPWIADFRDPMAQPGYPEDPKVWQSFDRVEKRTIDQARFSVFTTPGAARDYKQRYPLAASRINVIENGFDEESFAASPSDAGARQPLHPGAVTLLHSGIVYPWERDPTALFAAIGRLVEAGKIRTGELVLRFRASNHDGVLRSLAQRHRIEDVLELLPPIPYRAALTEMQSADGLLVLQASNCNDQVPAKLYEYLRARRPIVALTDPEGDTAGVARAAGLDTIARLDSVDEIEALLSRFIAAVRSGRAPLPSADYVARASRRERARELASLLDRAGTAH